MSSNGRIILTSASSLHHLGAVFWFSKKFRRLLQGSGNSDDEKKLARLESAKTSVKVVFGGPVVADLAVQPAFPPVQ